MKRKTRLCILGSNSGRNAGDAAILSSIVDNSYKLNKNLEYEVPTPNCRHIRKTFPDMPVRPVSIMPWTGSVRLLGLSTLRSIMRSDAVLITDGIIFDIKLFNPLFNFLILLAFLVPFAKLCGKKVLCFCVGVGPLDTGPGRMLTRMVCNLCDVVMVRERSSYDLLVNVGVKKSLIEVYADVAFINQPASEKRGRQILDDIGCPSSKEVIGINVNTYIDLWLRKSKSLNRDKFIVEFAAAVDSVIDELDTHVAFTITQIMDIKIAREIQGRMLRSSSTSLLSNKDFSNHDIMAAMGQMQLFIGMRLHSLILASAMYVPVLGLAYAPKVRHFMKMLDMEEMIYELEGISADALSFAIIDSYNRRMKIREALVPIINEVKEKVKAAFVAANERYYA